MDTRAALTKKVTRHTRRVILSEAKNPTPNTHCRNEMLRLAQHDMPRRSCVTYSGYTTLEGDVIGKFDEELPGVVQYSLRPHDFTAEGCRQQIDILRVSVIADEKRRPAIHLVGQQEIGVEVFSRIQIGKERVGRHGVVLENDAERELAVKLPVPLGAHDVIVETLVVPRVRAPAPIANRAITTRYSSAAIE